MENSNIQNKRPRSAAYPSVSLEDCITLLKQLHENLGSGPYDRLSAVQALGYKGISGAASSKVAALVHFGFLERLGSGYKETERARTVLMPIDTTEELNAIRESFLSPTLFNKLYSDFKGAALPVKLDVILARQYKITEQASKDVASIFITSAQYAGYLKDGFLISSTDDNSIDKNSDVPEKIINQSNENDAGSGTWPTNDIEKKASINQYDIDLAYGFKLGVPKDEMLQILSNQSLSAAITKLSEEIKKFNDDDSTNGVSGSEENPKNEQE